MRDLVPWEALQPSLAPFTDPNFKLAVMAELIDTRRLDLGDHVAFLRVVEGPGYDPRENGLFPSQKAYDYLGRYPLAKRHLDALRVLEFDRGLSIYPYVWPAWRGETAVFDVKGLADLRLLPGLERLNAISLLAATDLTPLRTARRLDRVYLGQIAGTWDNLDALLALPRLDRLSLHKRNLRRYFRNPVLRTLHERGVEVQLFG